jgi:hypothetical protein
MLIHWLNLEMLIHWLNLEMLIHWLNLEMLIHWLNLEVIDDFDFVVGCWNACELCCHFLENKNLKIDFKKRNFYIFENMRV